MGAPYDLFIRILRSAHHAATVSSALMASDPTTLLCSWLLPRPKDVPDRHPRYHRNPTAEGKCERLVSVGSRGLANDLKQSVRRFDYRSTVAFKPMMLQ